MGTALVLGAYALLNLRIITVDSFAYQAMNLIGSIGLLLISYAERAYQPAVLNLIWGVLAALGLVTLLIKG